ncbi:hypothetical protein Pan216_00540 [Planctomycetes bacterium Pan216]|uniref:DUF4280 domain-containing protein n=1 Tax=Kolteria novifilia TaxID=2527975 RepID=A0A518AWW4_9BACT|nr:hypothetical protein Pan216_00540 [Planctomycetes bacterium Pan216]
MPPVVCENATCMCAAGTAPQPLSVTSQMIYKIDGMKVATIMDMTPGVNLKPFGTCNILTASASGVPTPCVPAPVGPWQPGSVVQGVMGLKVLTIPATVNCGVGGVISVVQPNNIIEQSV